MLSPFAAKSPLRSILTIFVLLAFCLSFVPPALAQDFDFTDDGTSEEGSSDDDTSFDFTDGTSPEDNKPVEPDFQMPDGSKPIIVAFFEPGDSTPKRRTDALAEAVVKHLGDFEEYDSVIAVPILRKLEAMSEDERFDCAGGSNPACIADMGKEINAKYVIIGRIQTEGVTIPHIYLELIDTATGTVTKITDFDTQPRLRSQEKDLKPAVYSLFNKKVADIDEILKGTRVQADNGLPLGQLVSGIVIGVLALGSIGAGIYFGLDAKDKDDQVKKAIDDNRKAKLADVNYDGLKHQKKVKKIKDEAQQSAMIANILYAGGAVLGVVSLVLFLVRSDADEDLFASQPDLYVTPAISEEGGGVIAGFRF